MTVYRELLVSAVRHALRRSRVVVLVGPRQCGKTTLAREFVSEDSANYFDLEDPTSLARLDQPMTGLGTLKGLVVIDEVQRKPELFPVLRVLADRKDVPAQFLVLGSASGELLRQSSESLAGRVESVAIAGFTLIELGNGADTMLWLRGGFPRSFLASSDVDSFAWRKSFTQTLLERDMPQWGVRVPAESLRRFWFMIAHYHGQIWNAAEPARALGVSENTVRHYLDLLCDALMLRQLKPYHANLAKRQVKSPKIYVRDSGILHYLLGISTEKMLLEHPKVGASWEGFVIEQILATQPHEELYFWATHQGAEIDLLMRQNGKLCGVEIKRADAPKVTPSMRNALQDLGLERIAVVYPGRKRYYLMDQIEVVPLDAIGNGESLF